MPSSGRHRAQADRLELLDEWWRSCERLRDALRMPIGVPPRSWPDKLMLAQDAQDMLNRVVDEWSLRRRTPATTEAGDDTTSSL
jgi:hypothetical protein